MSEARYDLTGSVALVSGAGGDIGRAVAVRLARSGARVALLDLAERDDLTRETAARCGERGVAARVVPADVTDPAAVDAAVAEVVTTLGTPQLVFNNAGVQGAIVPTADYPADDARRVIEVNVLGVLHVLGSASRALRSAGLPGSVVNAASMAGVSGAANMVAYSASKGAVVSLTKSAARDLAPLGIRVNAVSPAFVGPGAMWERQTRLQAAAGTPYYSAEPSAVEDEMITQVPLRRLGSLDEVASVVTWLLSGEASYVTGENVLVTGGIV